MLVLVRGWGLGLIIAARRTAVPPYLTLRTFIPLSAGAV